MKTLKLLLIIVFSTCIVGCDFFNETKKLKEDLEYYKEQYEKTKEQYEKAKKEANRTWESYKRMWE